MTYSHVYGRTGRLGRALTEAFEHRGDHIAPLSSPLNYVVFAHRYRGPESMMDEFAAQVFTVAEKCRRLTPAAGDCGIVVVSSIVATNPTLDAPMNYTVAKAALNTLAEYLALLRDKTGFRVNIVSPAAFTGPNPAVSMQAVVDTILWICHYETASINGKTFTVTTDF